MDKHLEELNKLAKEIIVKNEYLALNTIDASGNPWTCILAYSFDDKFNFYFASLPSSRHCQNISENINVSFAVYDSTQGFGLGTGLQIEAIAEKVPTELFNEASKVYFDRIYPYGNLSNSFTNNFKNLLSKDVYCFYKLSPTKIWINDPHADTDKRVEVTL